MHPFPGETPISQGPGRPGRTGAPAPAAGMEEVAAAEFHTLPPGGVVARGLQPSTSWTRLGRHPQVRLSELFPPGRDSLAIYNYMLPGHSGDDRPGPTARGRPRRCRSPRARARRAPRGSTSLTPPSPTSPRTPRSWWSRRRRSTGSPPSAAQRGWRRRPAAPRRPATTFAHDYGGEVDGQQMPMLNVFQHEGGTIRHFWASELLLHAGRARTRTRATSARSSWPGTCST